MDNINWEEVFKGVSVSTERRYELGKRMNSQKKECPNCGTRQIQLIGYIDIIPAQWKCRKCKHKFEWEGE